MKSMIEKFCKKIPLSDDQRAIVLTHPYPKRLVYALSCMQKAKLFNRKNFSKLTSNAQDSLMDAITYLYDEGGLDQKNFDMIRVHPNPYFFAQVLLCFQKSGMLTQKTRRVAAAHVCRAGFADLVSCLHQVNLLNPSNLTLIIFYQNLLLLLDILLLMKEAMILNQKNFKTIIAQKHIFKFTYLLACLQKADILNQDNFEKLILSYSVNLVKSIQYIQGKGIFNQTSLTDLLSHPDLPNLTIVLSYFQYSKNLTLSSFNELVQHKEIFKLADLLFYIPAEEMENPLVFNEIISKPAIECLIHALIYLNARNSSVTGYFHTLIFHEAPMNLARVISLLRRLRLFTDANLTVAANLQYLSEFTYLLQLLEPNKHVNQQLFDTIIHAEHGHQKGFYHNLGDSIVYLMKRGAWKASYGDYLVKFASPVAMTNIIYSLHSNKNFNVENLDLIMSLIISHSAPNKLLNAFFTLSSHQIIHLFNPQAIAAYQKPEILVHAFVMLKSKGLLTEENIFAVFTHPKPLELANVLQYFLDLRMIDENLRTSLLIHAQPQQLAQGIELWEHQRILSSNDVHLLVAHQDPLNLADVLIKLERANIVTLQHKSLVSCYHDISYLPQILEFLFNAKLLDKTNLELLLAPDRTILKTKEAWQEIWKKIKWERLNFDVFQQLLVAAKHRNHLDDLLEVRRRIFRDFIRAPEPAPPLINIKQSTHTSSINHSVLDSAMKLMKRYGVGLNFEKTLREIIAYSHHLDSNAKHQAAKRCILKLSSENEIVDNTGMSNAQLLALVFRAIHDKSLLSCSVQDAHLFFIEGLYEIQRGYNIEQGQGLDDSPDLPICVGGTFNKLIEKLNGIHPDVALFFITKEGAITKFPKLAKYHAVQYLTTLTSPKTSHDFKRCRDLLDELKASLSLELIWENIQQKVRTDLWEEFHAAYESESDRQQFDSLIEYGCYISCPDLSFLDVQLMRSPGYHAYLAEQNSLNLHRLWSNRHSSPKDQLEFDRCYALTL